MAFFDIKDYMTEQQKTAVFIKEGKKLMDEAEYTDALECFDEAISMNPQYTITYNIRAFCHKNLHMFSEAYFDYSFLIRLEPFNGSHYCARGLCCVKLKRITLALKDFDTSIEVSYVLVMIIYFM